MITVVGIGPGGSSDYLFGGAKSAIEAADVIIGSERQLAIIPDNKKENCQCLPSKLAELAELLAGYPEDEVVLLASGDPLTYGIGKWLTQRVPTEKLTILPGISSLHYLFNRLKLPMEDCYITSSHGKIPDYSLLFQLPKVAMVTDKTIGPYQLAQEALQRGKNPTFYIGEKLSYTDETIRCCKADAVPDDDYQMNAVVILNEG